MWTEQVGGGVLGGRQRRHTAACGRGSLRRRDCFLSMSSAGDPTAGRVSLFALEAGRAAVEVSRTDASCPMQTLQVVLLGLLAYPPIPQNPANRRGDAAPTHDGYWADALLVDAHKAHDEYDDSADMLDDDRRISDQRPEVVRFQSRISLKVLQEGGLVGVVVGICSVSSAFARHVSLGETYASGH